MPGTDALLETLEKELSGHPNLRWRLQGLEGGAAGYALGRVLGGQSRPTLLITADARAAEDMAGDLRAVLGESLDAPFSSRRIHVLPPRETPPLEMVSPSGDVEAQRTAALYQLSRGSGPIVVTCPEALALRTVTPQRMDSGTLYVVQGDELGLEAFTLRLAGLGYRTVAAVEEPLETAVRGGIVDFWPPGVDAPCRIEFWGEDVESIRFFDPADQRSYEKSEEVVVLPSTPFPLERLADRDVRQAVDLRADDLLLPTSERRELDRCLAEGVKFPGVELLAGYVESERSWVGDYLPEDCLTVLVDPPAVDAAVDRIRTAIDEAVETATQTGSFFPDPDSLYVDERSLRTLLSARPVIEVDQTEALKTAGRAGNRTWRLKAQANRSVTTARALVKAKDAESGFEPIAEALREVRGASRLVVAASDPNRLEHLQHLLEGRDLGTVRKVDSLDAARSAGRDGVTLVELHLSSGFALPEDQLVVVTDTEIFGERKQSRRRRGRRSSYARALNTMRELEPGSHVVHVDHGVGQYKGLRHLQAAGTEGDFLHIEYAGGDRYYLPVDRIGLVEKYSGAGGAEPTLDKLGGTAWKRTKQKTRDAILEMARELLDVEAYRAISRRDAFVQVDTGFEEFEARFPFEETEGQLTAISDVVGDLTSDKPMDRVVCGDVGYGKTEVAVRAAYLAAMSGRQVAFLVPTTVLAQQHFDTLKERLEGYPLNVEVLSRFRGKQENSAVVEGVADGTVDIVVGTHRLLQADVKFARLGLVVIDEEHRFGVKAKEHIKKVRREVDVLTLTATPIPRTLQLSMAGIRDLSVIETPPVDRMAIRTYMARVDDSLIRQALKRELGRGGQAFFVHNRVGSIGVQARRIEELLPGARVGIGHGQMKEGELEKVMLQFLEHELDILVCTSIIESGLDIPNANTILVNRADTFGLAQLYQIRGRVGRSHRRAYAYLLVPGEQLITPEARKRLAVLQELDDLGGGFRLAAHDMEIRGAGNLLGKQQSGNIAAVGFELFLRMMEEATRELRGQKAAPSIEPELDLGAGAFLPDSYVQDVSERLQLYKRLANADTAELVTAIAEEIEDRFGPVPDEARRFVQMMRLRPVLKELAVESLKAGGGSVVLRLHETSLLEPSYLVELARQAPRRIRLRPDSQLVMRTDAPDFEAVVGDVERLLDAMRNRQTEVTGLYQPGGEGGGGPGVGPGAGSGGAPASDPAGDAKTDPAMTPPARRRRAAVAKSTSKYSDSSKSGGKPTKAGQGTSTSAAASPPAGGSTGKAPAAKAAGKASIPDTAAGRARLRRMKERMRKGGA